MIIQLIVLNNYNCMCIYLNYGQFFIFSQERKQEEKKERKFKKKEERLKRKEQEREEKEVMTWINIFPSTAGSLQRWSTSVPISWIYCSG